MALNLLSYQSKSGIINVNGSTAIINLSLSLAVQNTHDVDAVLAAYQRKEIGVLSNFNSDREQRHALVRHGIVVLTEKGSRYSDGHPWGK
jgi:hypothetical protein